MFLVICFPDLFVGVVEESLSSVLLEEDLAVLERPVVDLDLEAAVFPVAVLLVEVDFSAVFPEVVEVCPSVLPAEEDVDFLSLPFCIPDGVVCEGVVLPDSLLLVISLFFGWKVLFPDP
jgi:hypothetical protein